MASIRRKSEQAPLELWGFRVPDTSIYLTSRGISYRIKSGYRFNETTNVIFGVEFIGKGNHHAEAILGGCKVFEKFNGFGITAVTTFGKKFNMDISCNIPLVRQFFINAGYSTYNARSLYGERMTCVNKFSEKRGHELWMSLSKRY